MKSFFLTLFIAAIIHARHPSAKDFTHASSKPSEWNLFDIYYTAPRFRYNGSVEKTACITLVYNGVLTLNHFEIQGTIQYTAIPRYEVHDKASVRTFLL